MNGINTGKPPSAASPPDYSRQQFLRCFRPLHILSSTFALWPFGGWSSRFSRCSTLYVLAVVTAYSAFHLYINYTDAYSVGTGEDGGKPGPDSTPTVDRQQQVEANFVSIVIDVYNRYSGLILFWLLTADIYLPAHDIRFSLHRICRMVQLHHVHERFHPPLHLFDKNRLQLINDLLVELTAYGTDEEQAHYERFRRDAKPPDRGETVSTTLELLSEISSATAKPHHQSRTGPIERAANANTTAPHEPSIPRGGGRWHKIKRQQHKIITVNQAAPSVVMPPRTQKTPLPDQFPLLVASLLRAADHLQPTACERHIRAKIINDIKNLYTHLHLLSLNINKAYGAQLIFILMTLFVTLTTLLYYCTMKLFRQVLYMLWLGQWVTPAELLPTFWEVLSTLSWAFISTFRILRICNVCNSAKNEAQKIGSLIHGLGWKTNCPDTKSMVRLLSLQLHQQRIEFTASGLFTIDHGLMFNIVGSLATYLLILIQFDIAQNGAKWKTELRAPLV
ncbi:uncharacterized protein LOC120904957 [Anopheles arabiensis]|uniref:uncharacterized protein LOC120904957 n=1 Tax=Anopheles arabiensis TaxID=7173 RepID=UPI001AACADDA|nr:uncharacterized protein LOC120904957 [Anopheles arabiensis]